MSRGPREMFQNLAAARCICRLVGRKGEARAVDREANRIDSNPPSLPPLLHSSLVGLEHKSTKHSPLRTKLTTVASSTPLLRGPAEVGSCRPFSVMLCAQNERSVGITRDLRVSPGRTLARNKFRWDIVGFFWIKSK